MDSTTRPTALRIGEKLVRTLLWHFDAAWRSGSYVVELSELGIGGSVVPRVQHHSTHAKSVVLPNSQSSATLS